MFTFMLCRLQFDLETSSKISFLSKLPKKYVFTIFVKKSIEYSILNGKHLFMIGLTFLLMLLNI
jgi:hypothetical protein